MTVQLLDNIIWHTLSGPHARFAMGEGGARRYATGFSPIVGFRDADNPDFAALVPFCAPGEHFYCGGWSGPVPEDWRLDADSTMFNMVWDGDMPTTDEAPEAIPLGAAHTDAVLALAQLAQPGPFGPRTIELGEYFGIFENGQLIAMAGERARMPQFTEISAVCTDPDFQGRGHARTLMEWLLSEITRQGKVAFLHVKAENGAKRLYEKLGFHVRRVLQLNVVARR